MSGYDRDILSRYTSADHQSEASARAAHYDLMRSSGFSREKAADDAANAARQQMVTLGRALDAPATSASGRVPGELARPGRFRQPFPWEK